MIYLYFLLFYLLGIILWVSKKYDFLTIAFVFFICGLFLYFGNPLIFIYLLIFFSSAELITKIFNRKHEKRTYKNLLGNTLAPALFIMLGSPVAAIAGVCAAFSDTFSSEIGRLSSKTPILITTFKKTKKGTDGGITTLGTMAALVIAILTFLYFIIAPEILLLESIFTIKQLIIIGIFGFLGSIIDSYIGALIERKGLIDNYQTNFLATLIASFGAYILNILL